VSIPAVTLYPQWAFQQLLCTQWAFMLVIVGILPEMWNKTWKMYIQTVNGPTLNGGSPKIYVWVSADKYIISHYFISQWDRPSSPGCDSGLYAIRFINITDTIIRSSRLINIHSVHRINKAVHSYPDYCLVKCSFMSFFKRLWMVHGFYGPSGQTVLYICLVRFY
jgi:hypothetical protein